MTNSPKVIVIGLDCAEPTLMFDRWVNELPTIKKIISQGVYGKLKSSVPCITVPAWSSMVTGKDPGVLGCYGFRNRKDYSNTDMYIANSRDIKEKRIWDYLGEKNLKSIVIGVPQTYPVSSINGIMVSCFLTPAGENYTFPSNIKYDIKQILEGQDYVFDVVKFRLDDKNKILQNLYDMTNKRFKVITHFIKGKFGTFLCL